MSRIVWIVLACCLLVVGCSFLIISRSQGQEKPPVRVASATVERDVKAYVIVAVNPGARGKGTHAMGGFWLTTFEDPEWYGFYGDGTVHKNDYPSAIAKYYFMEITTQQLQRLRKFAYESHYETTYSKKRQKWHIYNNCTHWVVKLLEAGGIQENLVSTYPEDLGKELTTCGFQERVPDGMPKLIKPGGNSSSGSGKSRSSSLGG